jgi:hypothetical protein
MRFKLKKKEYKIGDLKSFAKFAWFPIKVEDHIVWLESYTSMCERKTYVKSFTFEEVEKWVEYDRRLRDSYSV